MAVKITRNGQPAVQLIAPCRPKHWPFPGDQHILNPQTRLCVRCGEKLPKDFVGFKAVVPDALKAQIRSATVQQEVGL